MKIRIYPGFRIHRYSFYIQGIQSSSRAKDIYYSSRGFPRFGPYYLTFVFEGNPERKVFIHEGDSTRFHKEGLEWCDVYAKVNVDPDSIPGEYASKIMAIGPSFGVRVFWGAPALWHAVKTYGLCVLYKDRYVINRLTKHFWDYWKQFWYRLPEDAYEPGVSSSDYIFFASSLWETASETNNYRALFIEACRSLDGIQFEGGFVLKKKERLTHTFECFQNLIVDKRYPLSEYIQKTKASAVVFNTPAVHQCHGWKLGEFLALGKAIVSTPLSRQLPAPLVHGRDIHYVDESPESMKSAVQLICQNSEYREQLERGARKYYLAYLKPSRVIERILKAAYAAKP